MDGADDMESLREALNQIQNSLDDSSLSSDMYGLYNSLRDCSDLGNLHEDLLDQIKSLSDRHKRYMCVLAIKLRSLPVFQCFFENELAPVSEENLSEDNSVFCELMYEGTNLFYKDFMPAAIHVGFPKGIKFMCGQDLKFDPEVVDDWCSSFMKEGEDGNKDFPNVRRPGINKYKQLEDITRHFASRGDADMLARILGRDDKERTRARKYIKHVEPALVSVVDVDETEEERAVKCLEMFVSAGADLNRPTSRIVNGFETSPTPLMIAALLCKTKIFEYLIQNGADVNRRDRLGENALHYLINSEKDTTACIDRIFSSGYRYEINVDKMIRIAYTPLHLAVVRNKIAIARKLIDRGADIHLPDRKGKNLIHRLAEIDSSQFSLELAKFLINSGLDKELRDVEGQTPLFAAVKNKNTALVKLLLEERCEMDSLCAYNTSSPLLMACEVFLSGQEDILLLLLESKCDVNFPNDVGVVALMKAAEYPSTDLASLLLRYGADVNRQDSQGMFATAYCFKKKGGDTSDKSCVEMLRYLIDNGIDVKKHNKENQLLLMSLVGGEYQCFDMLMDVLKDHDEVSKTGETIFHFFARSKNIDLSKYEYLFQTHRALSQKPNKHGITPLMMASFLLNKRYLEVSAKHLHETEINDCNEQGHTPLHFCVIGFTTLDVDEMDRMHGTLLDCVRLLVESGADVDMQDNRGKTALMMAAALMDQDLIRLLLEMGADADYVEDKYSLSALQFMDSGNTQGDNFMTCLKIFVSFGCDYALDRLDMHGSTLIQKQFRSMDMKYPYLDNIYCLLAANSTLRHLGSYTYGPQINDTDITTEERDELRKLLFLCGASIKATLAVARPLEREKDPELATDRFMKFANNVTLRSRCRRVIRQNIGGNIRAKLEEMRMPPGIHDFLLVNGEGRVEEAFIPRKYFHHRPTSPEETTKTGDSEDTSSKEDNTTGYRVFRVDRDDVGRFFEFFRWYSFYYIDKANTPCSERPARHISD